MKNLTDMIKWVIIEIHQIYSDFHDS